MSLFDRFKSVLVTGYKVWESEKSAETLTRLRNLTRGDLAIVLLLNIFPIFIAAIVFEQIRPKGAGIAVYVGVCLAYYIIEFALGGPAVWLMYRITGRGINGVTACRYFTIFKLFSLAFVPVGVLAIYGAYFNNIFENVGTVAYVGSAIALGTYLREHEGLRLRRTVIATVIVPFLFIAILGIGLVALSDSNIPAMIDYQQAMQQKDYKKAEETLIVLVDDELEQGDYMQAAQYALWLARLQNVELENPQQAKETIEGIFSYLPPEEEVKGRKAMALLYRRLAIANLDLNEKEQARENYKKALIAAKGAKDKELEVDLILDVAIEESDAGNHESAQAYLQDALAYKDTMDKGSLLSIYNSIAYTAFEQKKLRFGASVCG